MIKTVLLNLKFQDEGHLNANLLIYIPTIYRECLLFQLFSGGIGKPIVILMGIQNERISRPKNSRI